jgi:hypothetical protein
VVLHIQAVAVQVITSMCQALQVLASRLGASGFVICDNHRALYDGPVLRVPVLRAAARPISALLIGSSLFFLVACNCGSILFHAPFSHMPRPHHIRLDIIGGKVQ